MIDELVLKNEKLIYHILGKMGLYNKRDILYDVGLIGLCKAAKKFDPTKGYSFTTYAGNCIRNEILINFREENSTKRKANFNTVSLDEPVCYDSSGNELTVIDVLKSDVDIEAEIIKKEQKEVLYNALTKLQEKELLVLNYTYGLNGYEELNQFEISEKINVSQAQISRIKSKAIKKIKSMIGED